METEKTIDGLASAVASVTIPDPIPDSPAYDPAAFADLGSPEFFDPAIHAVDETGQPRKTASGKFARKRGPRKGGVAPVAPQQNATAVAVKVEDPAKRRLAAHFCASMIVGVGVNLFGEEWVPRRYEMGGQVFDELENMTTAFDDYFKATGISDLPPGMALIFAITTYAAPKLGSPKTKEKIGAAIAKLRGKSPEKAV
jgi:hypothetical protein